MIPSTDPVAAVRAELRRGRNAVPDDAAAWIAYLEREADWQRGPVFPSLAEVRALAVGESPNGFRQ